MATDGSQSEKEKEERGTGTNTTRAPLTEPPHSGSAPRKSVAPWRSEVKEEVLSAQVTLIATGWPSRNTGKASLAHLTKKLYVSIKMFKES